MDRKRLFKGCIGGHTRVLKAQVLKWLKGLKKEIQVQQEILFHILNTYWQSC